MKIQPLFKYSEHGLVRPELTPGCEWVLEGKGWISAKLDGITVRVAGTSLLKRTTSGNDSTEIYISCKPGEDDVLIKACGEVVKKPDGIYVIAGPGIRGNPHNLKDVQMVGVYPIDTALIIYSSTGIIRGTGITVQMLYDSIQKTLSDPLTDAEGVVFHHEQWLGGRWIPLGLAQVTRKDFGLPWPPVSTETVLVSSENPS